jgi:hypothetical protein
LKPYKIFTHDNDLVLERDQSEGAPPPALAGLIHVKARSDASLINCSLKQPPSPLQLAWHSPRMPGPFRLAHALLKRAAATEVTVFLLADAGLAAEARQKTPEGYYNLERILRRVLNSKGAVLLCGIAWTHAA